VLTSDGSGGIVAESNLTFDSAPGLNLNRLSLTGFQTINDTAGTQPYSLRIFSAQTTQISGHSSVDINNIGDATTVLDVTGQRVSVSDATTLNTGIDASVSGAVGDGTGVKISNTIDTAASTQYGSTIQVTGIEVPPPLSPYGTSKWGSSIIVTGDARSNEGMSVTVSDGERNQGIGVSVSGTSASTNTGMLVNVSDGQMNSLGIGAAVSGTVGNGIGVQIFMVN
jgi:hypothetical protein